MGDEPVYDQALSGDVTELAPSASETVAQTAWALDDGPEWKPPRFSSGQVTAMGVAAAVVLVAGVSVLAWVHLRGEGPAEATATTTVSSTVEAKPSFWPKPTKTVPLPPATVTVTAPPPPPVTQQVAVPQAEPTAPSTIPDLVPFNDEFIDMIQQRGWNVWDRRLMLNRAHATCSMLRGGENPDLIASKLMGAERQLNWQMAVQFVGTVRDAYPNCG